MQLFSKNAVFFAVKTCLSGFLALYLSLELNLDKPAWAISTVFIASQLYSASTISKSLFRMIGTLLGGVFIFIIFPVTVEHPLLFSLCISLWVSVCLYLSLHDRTPKSYVFMLAGYSAAFMGFPEVMTPMAFTNALISRVEEIAVGTLCSSMVHALLLPVSMRSLLEQSVSKWYLDACKLCSDLLSHIPSGKPIGRDEILTRITGHPQQVEILITHCVYYGDAARRLIRLVSVQYQHLSYLNPTLTAIEMRLQRLWAQQISFPENLAVVFRLFLRWLNDREVVGDISVILQELNRCQSYINAAWRNGDLPIENCMLLTGLLERMADFVRIADAYQSVGGLVSNLSGDTTPARGKQTHRFYDKGMIRLSALMAFCATFGSCLLWIGTGWQDGASAPVMAAILGSLFASMYTPLTSMKLFMRGVIVAIFISVIYVALLIPQATSFEALIICLAPGFLLLGLMIARPSSNMIAISVAIQLPGFIGLVHHVKPDLVVLINNAIASLTGVLFAVVLTVLIRNKRPSWTARRAVRQGLQELLRFIKELERNGSSLLGRQRFISLMLDKVNVVLPRLRLDPNPDMSTAGMLLTEVWVGVNSFDYYARHKDLLARYQLDSGQMFHELALYLKDRLKAFQTQPHSDLLNELDMLILMLEKLAKHDESLLKPLFHLSTMRLYLFPQQSWPIATPRQLEVMQQHDYRQRFYGTKRPKVPEC